MPSLTDIIRQDAERIIGKVDLSPLAGKDVVVTGASGLIGTYVTACLDVFGKCKLVLRVSKNEPKPGVPVRSFCNKWLWIAHDLSSDRPLVLPADHLFYAAGYGQPAKFVSRPLATLAINTSGLQTCLATVRVGGRTLYVSSSEVYSGNQNPPFDTGDIGTTLPQHPRGCYIEGKRCGEAICAAYNAEFMRNSATAARVALAYGPGTRKDDDRAINQFIRQAIQDRRIVLKDTGQVMRTYCYITDAVEFMLSAWLRGTYPVYNVGGKSKTTIANLARTIGAICDVPVEIPSTMNDLAAPDNVTLDMRQAEGEFGKTTYVPLDDGLRRTIEWQRMLYGQNL